MNAPNTGSRRPTSDTAHVPSEPSPQDAADAGLRVHNQPAQGHAAKPPSSNLLLPRSPLIGRDHEVAAVQHLLLQEEVGLLTLTGPGGVGKTRLALQVAANLLDHFVDGVYFISLAPITDAALVIPEIAQTLGLREAGGRPFQASLQDYLRDRQLLLVLDNFEQVLVAAPLVAALLPRCRRLKVLVTSRATLHLYGEHEFPVPPLALPDPNHLTIGETDLVARLTPYAAVELFCQRARATKPDFTLTETNAPAVAEICIGLDGLPLAIELAAAKTKLFSPSALLARLKQRLTLLTGGPHDLPARQRTLRDEIAWSYDLLTAAEQVLFRRLAIFVGGFNLETAQVVVDKNGDLGIDVLKGVAALADQNLLKQLEQSSGEPRFGMLETIREYGLERLAASGEAEAIHCQHASCFLALAENAELHLGGIEEKAWADQLERDYDNLRSALRWYLGTNAEVALRLAGGLSKFWFKRGYFGEGRSWLAQALAQSNDAPTVVLAKASLGAGEMAGVQGDYAHATAWLEQSLNLYNKLDNRLGSATALNSLGAVRLFQKDYAGAQSLLEQSLALWREHGDQRTAAMSLNCLGMVSLYQGNYTQATKLLEESLVIMRAIGDTVGIDVCCTNLGYAGLFQGDTMQAVKRFTESIALGLALGDRENTAWCLEGLAEVVGLHLSNPEHSRWAASLLGAADVLRKTMGAPIPPLDSSLYEQCLSVIRTQIGEVVFSQAWAAGQAMSVEQVVDYALATAPDLLASALSKRESSPIVLSPPAYAVGLTAREVEVLRLLAMGLTNQEIANQLVLSRRTVHAHLRSIYSKLDVTTRNAATRAAVELNLL